MFLWKKKEMYKLERKLKELNAECVKLFGIMSQLINTSKAKLGLHIISLLSYQGN